MLLFLDYYNLSLFLGGVVALLSGCAVYFSDRRKAEGLSWLLLNLSTAVWSFGYFVMITSIDRPSALLANWILHFGAILIPLFYFYFILSLTKTFKRYRGIFFLTLPLTVFFLVVNTTHHFIDDVFPKGPFNFAPNAGVFYPHFTIYFFLITIYAQTILYRTIQGTLPADRVRLWYVFYSSIAGFLGGGSVFLLTYNIPIPPYPLVLFAFYPVIIAIAILRYKLFNIKIISTELLSGVIWVTLLFRMLLANNLQDQIVTGVLLTLMVFFGVLLIRSVYREVEQRERIEKLAKDLEKANERLQELDKLKSEFVSLATHQIRGPLTAIKGYSSEILDGDFGTLPDYLRDPVDRIYTSSQSLVVVVEDFLDVSRIEQGKMKYDFIDFDFGKLVREIVAELKPNFEKKKLECLVELPQEAIGIHADMGKIKQVVSNLIDNSIKYTPKGSIHISLAKDVKTKKVLLSIKDTGVGIPKETIPKLFQKFSRAEDASKANILGTGLGLYVAKELIKAHNGRVWAESEGKDKGSQFSVELSTIG